MNPARWFAGWAEAEIRGAQPEVFLKALTERGIPFWEVLPPKDFSMGLKLPLRAAKLVPKLAEGLGCEGEVLSMHGPAACWRKLRGRWMLLGGALITVFLLFFSGLFLWNVEITGCETVSERAVRQAMAECGVDIGTCILGIDQDQFRNSMLLRLPELRWITVSVRGSHARVILREARTGDVPVEEKKSGAIVAEKAGLVTEVYALRGTAEKEMDQVALPGETLIGGYTTGRFGVQGETLAIGEVWARTWYERTAAAPVEMMLTVPTGEREVRFSLILGKKRINFYKESSICPVECDKITYVYPLALEGVFVLPVSLEKTVLTACEYQSLRAEELRAELETQLMEELCSDIGTDGEVLSCSFTAGESDGVLYVTLRAECHEQIGVSVPLTEAQRWEIQSKIPKTEESDT